jgi:hypothetical protein
MLVSNYHTRDFPSSPFSKAIGLKQRPLAAWQDVTAEVKRMLPISQMLPRLGWRTYHSKRADCGLCKGNSKATIAFNEQLWRCHRCSAGGDVIRLIELANNCDFMTALKFLAEEARVELPGSRKLSPKERRRSARERAEHECYERELDEAVAECERRERVMRRWRRRQIHRCDRVLYKPGPWTEQDWLRAKAASVMRESLLIEYTLLSFGALEQRVRYLVSDERKRASILAALRWAGGVTTNDGPFVEVGT